MENAEFIAQMAQFSTVTGITDMNSTLSNMADQLRVPDRDGGQPAWQLGDDPGQLCAA